MYQPKQTKAQRQQQWIEREINLLRAQAKMVSFEEFAHMMKACNRTAMRYSLNMVVPIKGVRAGHFCMAWIPYYATESEGVYKCLEWMSLFDKIVFGIKIRHWRRKIAKWGVENLQVITKTPMKVSY